MGCDMHKGNRLSEILYEKGLTYESLSKLSGVSKSTLNKIANFQVDPKQLYLLLVR